MWGRAGGWLLCLLLAGCGPRVSPERIVLSGSTMGTTYRVVIPELPDEKTADELHQLIKDKLVAINRQMSTWAEDSEISRFNRATKISKPFQVSAEFVKVVRLAKQIHSESNKAFDPTVMPLVKLWNFGPGKSDSPVVPTQKEVDRALKKIGFDAIEVSDSALTKTAIPRSLDLSAIAKGFGVDAVCELLDDAGVESYLVEIGGEVRAKGKKLDDKSWRVGVLKPQQGRVIQKVVSLSNIAMATSGDYRNFYERDGKRYSHTIDPRIGRPVSHQLASVSVLASDCATADGYATALMVLGPEAGYNWAREKNLPVLMILRDGKKFVEKSTPAWDSRFAD